MSNAVLHLEDCTVVHLRIQNPEAYDEVKMHSIYDQRVGDEVVAYGKDDDFFEMVSSLTATGAVIFVGMSNQISAMVKL